MVALPTRRHRVPQDSRKSFKGVEERCQKIWELPPGLTVTKVNGNVEIASAGTQPPEAMEESGEGSANVVKTTGHVGVTTRSEVLASSWSLSFTHALEPNEEGNTKPV